MSSSNQKRALIYIAQMTEDNRTEVTELIRDYFLTHVGSTFTSDDETETDLDEADNQSENSFFTLKVWQ